MRSNVWLKPQLCKACRELRQNKNDAAGVFKSESTFLSAV